MKSQLKKLLSKLDDIAKRAPDIGSTDVREELFEIIWSNFISEVTLDKDFWMPDTFHLPAKIEKELKSALEQFLAHANAHALKNNLTSPEKRLASFQDQNVETKNGNSVDEYFGWCDPETIS